MDQIQFYLRIKPDSVNTSSRFHSRINALLASENPITDWQASKVLQDNQSLKNRSGVGQFQIFDFKDIFPQYSSQQDVYERIVEPIIENQSRGCFIVFGPTQSGKSYTLRGGEGHHRGVLMLAVEYLLNLCQQTEHVLKASAAQIYFNGYTDLLSGSVSADQISFLKRTITSIIDFHQFLRQSIDNRDKRIKNKIHYCIQLEVYQKQYLQNLVKKFDFIELAGSEYADVSVPQEQQEKQFIIQSYNSLASCLINQMQKVKTSQWNQSYLTRYLKPLADLTNQSPGESSIVLVCTIWDQIEFKHNMAAILYISNIQQSIYETKQVIQYNDKCFEIQKLRDTLNQLKKEFRALLLGSQSGQGIQEQLKNRQVQIEQLIHDFKIYLDEHNRSEIQSYIQECEMLLDEISKQRLTSKYSSFSAREAQVENIKPYESMNNSRYIYQSQNNDFYQSQLQFSEEMTATYESKLKKLSQEYDLQHAKSLKLDSLLFEKEKIIKNQEEELRKSELNYQSLENQIRILQDTLKQKTGQSEYQIQDYKNKNLELQKEIESLQEQMSSEIHQWKQQGNKLDQEKEKQGLQIDELEHQLINFKKQKDLTDQQLHQTQVKLQNCFEQIADLEQQIKLKIEVIDKLQRSNLQLSQQVQDFEADYDSLQNQNQELIFKINQEQQSNKRLTLELEKYKTVQLDLSKNVQLQQAEISREKSSYSEISTRFESQQIVVQEQTEQIRGLKKQLQQTQATKNHITEQLNQIQVSFEHLQRESEEEKTQLMQQVKTLQAKNVQLQDEVDQKESKCNKLIINLEQLRKEHNNLKDLDSKRDQSMKLLRNQITDLKAENDQKSAKFAELDKSYQIISRELDLSKQNTERELYDRHILEKQIKKSENKQSMEIANLEEMVDVIQKELECLRQKNKSLQDQNEQQTQKIRRLEAQKELSSQQMLILEQKNNENQLIIRDL